MCLTLITNPISLKNGALHWQFDKQMAWLRTSHPPQHSTLNMGKTSLLSLRSPCPLKWANYQKDAWSFCCLSFRRLASQPAICSPPLGTCGWCAQRLAGYGPWYSQLHVKNIWNILLFFKDNKRSSLLFAISPLAISQAAWYRPRCIINEDQELNILWEYVHLTTISQQSSIETFWGLPHRAKCKKPARKRILLCNK